MVRRTWGATLASACPERVLLRGSFRGELNEFVRIAEREARPA